MTKTKMFHVWLDDGEVMTDARIQKPDAKLMAFDHEDAAIAALDQGWTEADPDEEYKIYVLDESAATWHVVYAYNGGWKSSGSRNTTLAQVQLQEE